MTNSYSYTVTSDLEQVVISTSLSLCGGHILRKVSFDLSKVQSIASHTPISILHLVYFLRGTCPKSYSCMYLLVQCLSLPVL